MMKLLITTTQLNHSIPSHRLAVVTEDGHEVDISGLVSRFTEDHPAGELGTITLYLHGTHVEHRTVYE